MSLRDYETNGILVMLDLWGCDFEILNNSSFLSQEAKVAAERAGMHVLAISIVPFNPQGVSVALILSESHLTIHSSPEEGYAAIDIFTCGSGNPQIAANYLLIALKPTQFFTNKIERGAQPSIGADEIKGEFQFRGLHHG